MKQEVKCKFPYEVSEYSLKWAEKILCKRMAQEAF